VVFSTISILAIVYAFTLVTQTDPSTVTGANPGGHLYGWSYWLVWVLLGAGVILLGSFALYALRRSSDPALDLRQFGRRDFLLSSLFTWATAIITYGLLVLMPIYFEAVRRPHLSALDTGLALVPFGVGTILGTVIAAALYRALGPRRVILLAAALAGLSDWVLVQTIQSTATASQLLASVHHRAAVPAVVGADDLRWGLLLLGLSEALISVPVQTLALEALKGEALAKASSLFGSTKLIFSSIGVAIITTIFVERTQSQATDLAHQVQALLPGSGLNLPAPHRRLNQVCAPGYTGRKRGEVVRTRTTVLQPFTHQWIGTYGGAGNGKYRSELKRALGAITWSGNRGILQSSCARRM
jgi:hypothetical protein